MPRHSDRSKSIFLAGITAILGFSPLLASAQSQPESLKIFRTYCAACHGQNGEGSRGARLATPHLVHAADEESLVRVISDGVPGTEMLRARLEPEQVRALAKLIWGWTQQPMPQVSGNLQRGSQVYAAKGQCSVCHAIRGEGGVYGPDLTEVGIRRGADFLKRALVDPSADIPENFSQYRWVTTIPDNFLFVEVSTRDGKKIAGSRVNEDVFSIVIRDPSGELHSLNKADLKSIEKNWRVSPMPSYAHLNEEEMTDLVAYLSSLRGGK